MTTTIRIAICDDEPVALNYISKVIQTEFELFDIQTDILCFSHPEQLVNTIKKDSPFQILFLDMSMPTMNGLDVASIANQLTPSPLIVFITSKEEYVFESFRVSPFRFIRKTDFKNEIHDCIKDIIEEFPERVYCDYITLSCQHNLYRLNIRNIIYIESFGKNVQIVMKDKTLELKYSLSELEALLKPHHFLRIHKSYLVNGSYLFSIEPREVVLTTNLSLPLSRYRTQEVKQQFQEMILCHIH